MPERAGFRPFAELAEPILSDPERRARVERIKEEVMAEAREGGCAHNTLVSDPVTADNEFPIHRCEDCGDVVIHHGADEGSGGVW